MKNTFGTHITLTLFGESHGEAIGAVIDGLAPGILIDEDRIRRKLALRRPSGNISTARKEADEFRIVSGVFNGHTTGTPLCLLIPNTDTHSKDYSAMRTLARPGHADYTAHLKYHGFADYRGGGHFSGRITAPLVAAGAIFSGLLEERGIVIGTHILRCAGIADAALPDDPSLLSALNEKPFATVSDDCGEKMREAIRRASEDGDSVGGVLETVAIGVPGGIGEPWFDSVESVLSHALFSIPAVKGVSFGDGFAMADLRGSEANDAFYTENGVIRTRTNHNGGINGGITNGMPLRFSVAVKPTPSIYLSQDTVDFEANENTTLTIEGRHDPAILHRARIVVDSVTAFVLCDLLAVHGGTEALGGF